MNNAMVLRPRQGNLRPGSRSFKSLLRQTLEPSENLPKIEFPCLDLNPIIDSTNLCVWWISMLLNTFGIV